MAPSPHPGATRPAGGDFSNSSGKSAIPGLPQYLQSGDLDFAYAMDESSRFRCNYLKQQQRLGGGFPSHPHGNSLARTLGVSPRSQGIRPYALRARLGHRTHRIGKIHHPRALLDYININFNRHIITIEEPIEFVHPTKNPSSPSARSLSKPPPSPTGCAPPSAKTPNRARR